MQKVKHGKKVDGREGARAGLKKKRRAGRRAEMGPWRAGASKERSLVMAAASATRPCAIAVRFIGAIMLQRGDKPAKRLSLAAL